MALHHMRSELYYNLTTTLLYVTGIPMRNVNITGIGMYWYTIILISHNYVIVVIMVLIILTYMWYSVAYVYTNYVRAHCKACCCVRVYGSTQGVLNRFCWRVVECCVMTYHYISTRVYMVRFQSHERSTSYNITIKKTRSTI